MAFGDGWEKMTVTGVQAYASSSVTQAYGTVWNLRLSSSLILKVRLNVSRPRLAFIYIVRVHSVKASNRGRRGAVSQALFCP